ncbi:MBG domain-containing protein, partial [Hymenobacter frigidus]
MTVSTTSATPAGSYNFNVTADNVDGTATLVVSNKRAITVTADANQKKEYGGTDPTLTYSLTAGTLASGDQFSGALARALGEGVGSAYAINKGTLVIKNGTTDVTSNYNLTFTGANFAITTRAITVTADTQTKTYGTADPAPLTYKMTTGTLATGDSFTGVLSRAAGGGVGSYAIGQNTLTAGSNYTLTYVPANLTITRAPLAVAANNQTKVYGAANPVLTGTLTG